MLAQAGGGAWNDWVLERLASSKDVRTTALLLMAGGLPASLLPCVYPLYPITATVVRAWATRGPVWAHPLAYYFGLCLCYAALGLVATVTGGALNMILHLCLQRMEGSHPVRSCPARGQRPSPTP
jgi:thiol:disulfide interchange protein DsbD